jgi:hypothetical protein
MLNVACWDRADWAAVADAPTGTDGQGNLLLGFWTPWMPRWLELSPDTCTDLQGLIDSRKPNGRRAQALTTLIHEAVHAHGIRNEAKTNCVAVQLVPFFAQRLGFSPSLTLTLSRLALSFVRSHAPSGYWNGSSCRDGGTWDLFPHALNLTL